MEKWDQEDSDTSFGCKSAAGSGSAVSHRDWRGRLARGGPDRKPVPAAEDWKTAILHPGAFHKSLKGDMADVCRAGLYPGERLRSADALGELFLCEFGFYSGLLDKQIGVMYWHEISSI